MLATLLRNKRLVSGFLGALVLIHVLWDYFGGGITVHHLLAREDMPGISNAWGIFTVTLLAYYTLHRIEIRYQRKDAHVWLGFAGGLVLGLTMAVLWEAGWQEPLPYLLWSPVLLAFFLPVHRAECLLGFVLGMAYTFGGVLPVLFGGVLCLITFLIHRLLRGGFLRLLERM